LPTELREQYAYEITEFLKGSDITKLFAPIEIDHIKRYSTYLLEVTAPHQEKYIEHKTNEFTGTVKDTDVLALQKDFKSFFTQYDQRRSRNFVATFPRLAKWYNEI